MYKKIYTRIFLCLLIQLSLQAVEDKPDNPLYQAVENGQTKIVAQLLQKGVDIDERNAFNKTALHAAVESNSLKMVQLLVIAGANLELKSYVWYQWTPLHSAVYENNLEIVQYLVSAGANINANTYLGYTPLDLAFWYDASDKIIYYIINHGGYLYEYKNYLPENAIKRGNTKLLQTLLNLGCNVDAQKYENKSTALHIAVKNNLYSTVIFLLNAGANPDICDEFGYPPVHYAHSRKFKKLFLTR